VKSHDGDLAQAISGVYKVIEEVNARAKQVEMEIQAACEKLREMANEREAQLLSEVETVRFEKEKELLDQKHHLEFLLIGIHLFEKLIFSFGFSPARDMPKKVRKRHIGVISHHHTMMGTKEECQGRYKRRVEVN